MKPTTQRNRVKVVNNINVLGVHCLKTFISQTLPRIGMFCTIAKHQTLSCLKTFFALGVRYLKTIIFQTLPSMGMFFTIPPSVKKPYFWLPLMLIQ